MVDTHIIASSSLLKDSGGAAFAIYPAADSFFSSRTLSISGCSFVNNTGAQSSVSVTQITNTNISSSTFVGNQPQLSTLDVSGIGVGEAFIDNCIFTSNIAIDSTGGGGSVFVMGRLIKLVQSQFIGNIALGALYLGKSFSQLDGTHQITTTIFRDNFSGDFGGAILVLSSQVIATNIQCYHNTALHGGGCVAIVDGSVELKSTSMGASRLVNNSASSGGAIWWRDAKVDIELALMTNNIAFGGFGAPTGGGGAVALTACKAKSTLSTYSDNRAMQGGAWSLESQAELTISSDTYRNNIANEGGALFVRNSLFTNALTTMIDNHAVPSSSSSSSNWIVVGNGVGGAISIRHPFSTCEIRGSVFQSCSAVLGGALFFEHGVILSSPLFISKTSFINDSASASGGAIFYTDAYGLWQFDNQLINNKAIHGHNFATPAVSLELINSSTIATPIIILPGDLLPSLSFMLVDRLNQVRLNQLLYISLLIRNFVLVQTLLAENSATLIATIGNASYASLAG
jgi:hypothetical protein